MSKYPAIQEDLFKLSILPCSRLKLEKTKEQLLEDIVLPKNFLQIENVMGSI